MCCLPMYGLKFGIDGSFVVSKKCVCVLIMIFWGTFFLFHV